MARTTEETQTDIRADLWNASALLQHAAVSLQSHGVAPADVALLIEASQSIERFQDRVAA